MTERQKALKQAAWNLEALRNEILESEWEKALVDTVLKAVHAGAPKERICALLDILLQGDIGDDDVERRHVSLFRFALEGDTKVIKSFAAEFDDTLESWGYEPVT